MTDPIVTSIVRAGDGSHRLHGPVPNLGEPAMSHEDDPAWDAWEAAATADGLTAVERRLAARLRIVADDDRADWGWCVRCRLPFAPSHRCFYPWGTR